MNVHARHWIVLKITMTILKPSVRLAGLPIICIERAKLRANADDFIWHDDASMPLVFARSDKLSFMCPIVPGTYFGQDTLLDELFAFETFEGFGGAFIK